MYLYHDINCLMFTTYKRIDFYKACLAKMLREKLARYVKMHVYEEEETT